MAETDPRPYKQVARAQARQRTQDALLDAAAEEFYGDRWNKTSLEALAAKVGVTKQTLLRHFGSKDMLLLQALMRAGARMLEQRWSAPKGDVDGTVDNLIDHCEDWGERALRIGAWQEKGPAVLAKLSQAARQVHYGWVEYAFEPWLDGVEEPERSRRRAALIAICDVNTWWLLSHDLDLPRSEVHAIITKAIHGLLAVEADQ